MGLSNPRDVDGLELWEIAAILGANDASADGTGPSGLTPGQQRALDLERERPEWMDDDVSDEEAMMELQQFVRG